MSTDDTEKPEKSVVRTVEYLTEGMGRLRHDVSMMSAQLEIVRSHIQTKQELIDDLRVLQADTKVAQARTEALEHRAEQAEHLARRIESDTIHRAELTDWRRATRRFNILIAIVGIFILATVTAGYAISIHDDNEMKAQVNHIQQHFCDFLRTRAAIRGTTSDKALADEAAKLLIGFGCKP